MPNTFTIMVYAFLEPVPQQETSFFRIFVALNRYIYDIPHRRTYVTAVPDRAAPL